MKVKICGVTLPEDAQAIAAAGADYLGLNLWAGSRRHVAVDHAMRLAAAAREAGAPGFGIVGVFVDAEPIAIAAAATAIGLDAIQLHGDETRATCEAIAAATGVPVWKAVAVRDAADVEGLDAWPVDALLLDAPSPGKGGAGVRFDWTLARRAVEANPARRIVLAGGLTPEVVGDAVAQVQPWAVDVASGVESSPGVKDHDRVRAFIAAARG